MNCLQYEVMLSAYLDNELDSADRRTVCAHLEDCPFCLKELDRLQNTKKIISGLGKREPAPFFETRVISRIRAKESVPAMINDFIAAARKVIYLGIGILAITVGINRLFLSPVNLNPYLELEEIMLPNNATDIKGRIIMKTEITENDIMSLALKEEEENG
ncbi:MAG: zf-HC2 domain-containing protein [Elusimicrobiota bacterium]